MWLSLQNIKMGRLHLAITVLEANNKVILFFLRIKLSLGLLSVF